MTPAVTRAQTADTDIATREPPIVARCVVEVRSDGSLSIARGVFEVENERVVLEGIGNTPKELVSMLARAAFDQARERLQGRLRSIEHKLLGSPSEEARPKR